MKKIFKISLFLLFIFSSSISWSKDFRPYTVYATVVAVLDGDTLKVQEFKTHNPVYSVRLAGVDAPEKNQEFGPQATQLVKGFVLNKSVKILVINIDRYNRKVGYVYFSGKNKHASEICLNNQIVSLGLAWFYYQYSKDPILKNLEEGARLMRIGLWIQDDPTPPWIFRKKPRVWLYDFKKL